MPFCWLLAFSALRASLEHALTLLWVLADTRTLMLLGLQHMLQVQQQFDGAL
jgi:hypothetical protein